MEKFNIKCETCKVNVKVSKGLTRRTVQPAVDIYYCAQCKKIQNDAQCACGAKGKILPVPKFEHEVLKPTNGMEGRSFYPKTGTIAITECPFCGQKSLKWEFLEGYEI